MFRLLALSKCSQKRVELFFRDSNFVEMGLEKVGQESVDDFYAHVVKATFLAV